MEKKIVIVLKKNVLNNKIILRAKEKFGSNNLFSWRSISLLNHVIEYQTINY